MHPLKHPSQSLIAADAFGQAIERGIERANPITNRP